ncbi:MAG: beta-ketoacyl-ACP reductase [Alphaproteobacteria bacterium]
MFDLSNQRALVTGASGGLGQAIARALYHQGAHVVLTGRNEGSLHALQAELGARAHVIAADLAQPSAAQTLMDQAVETLGGGIEILVNNAGLTRDGLLMRQSDEDWETVLAVNLTAVMRLSRAALKPMMKARYGRMIMIGSVVGSTGNAGQTNYVASKAGLAGFAKALALEVAPRGICVNTLCPGFIASDMTHALNEDQKQAILSKIPLKTMGTPDDIAAGVVFLASREAGYVTGTTLHINGGLFTG